MTRGRRAAALLATAALFAACTAGPTGTAAVGKVGCDRACLRGQIDGYLAALIAHDPRRLPLAQGARFTEDTVEKPLGAGLWKTATGLRGFRQDYLDERAGVAAAHVMIAEGGKPVMLALRLKVEARQLREIETMTVHDAKEGMFFEPDALQAPSIEMAKTPDPGQRETRENAIRIAEGYPAGLKVGSFVKADTQLAADAYRFENGRRMAGPGCTFMPPSCENMKAQRIPTLAGITWRVVAVDEQQGLVLLRLDFGPGSLMGPDNRWLHAWEAFKVYGGQIHAAEAFMRGMPANTPSGW
jgi:hypothetical protein